MSRADVPEFAVVGHPNEGKSSVLSTLAEDDSVRVSPVPGETTECRAFPVVIDGREVIRFVDTPGFQNPRRVLQWLRRYQGPDERMLGEFIAAHEGDPDFHDDCELLTPLRDGSGVIFVVDGSRPVRNMDRAEMEILRLTGRPRMAIINCKEDDTTWLGQWQSEFRKHFNAIRVFNSCRATYAERIGLLESLKAIDQELQQVLEQVVTAFRRDWAARNERTAAIIVSLLADALSYRKSVALRREVDEERIRQRLHDEYVRFVARLEARAHGQIRSLFRHNIFDCRLPSQSILHENLASARTWQFLGLNPKQLIVAGAVGGAVIGAGVDVAAAGISFGVFSAIGGVLGAAGTALRGRELLSGARLLGMRLDREELRVGPVVNIQLLYVLLDRALLFYRHIINWAHGRRDFDRCELPGGQAGARHGFTTTWDRQARQVCERFLRAMQEEMAGERAQAMADLQDLVMKVLGEISRDRARTGPGE
ncbi:GTPase/DUF3482 domain-containing protein [Thermodesulfobacteriota bacterium B35]